VFAAERACDALRVGQLAGEQQDVVSAEASLSRGAAREKTPRPGRRVRLFGLQTLGRDDAPICYDERQARSLGKGSWAVSGRACIRAGTLARRGRPVHGLCGDAGREVAATTFVQATFVHATRLEDPRRLAGPGGPGGPGGPLWWRASGG
jgi:hypothetical protein